jgi:hypothetical protein
MASFRIITWNIPLNNGTFRYFGFVELQSDTLFRLQETENGRAGLMNDVLPAPDWYGALYYSLIVTRFEKISYYTLLGWDGNDPSSNRKVVDMLSLMIRDFLSLGHRFSRQKTDSGTGSDRICQERKCHPAV